MVGDRLVESNETSFVNLTSAVNATILDGQGTGTIVDNEPRISISDVTKLEGKKGKKTTFTFTVTLSVYDQPVTLWFRTADGTATSGSGDHVARTGTLTFRPRRNDEDHHDARRLGLSWPLAGRKASPRRRAPRGSGTKGDGKVAKWQTGAHDWS